MTTICPKDYFNYSINEGDLSVSEYFSRTPAKNWSPDDFFNTTVNSDHITRKLKSKTLNESKNDLEKIMHSPKVPLPVQKYASELRKLNYKPESGSSSSDSNRISSNNTCIIRGDNNYSFFVDNARVTKKLKVSPHEAADQPSASNAEDDNDKDDNDEDDDEEDDYEGNLDASFCTESTDDSFILYEENNIAEDKVSEEKTYLLSLQEISQPIRKPDLLKMSADASTYQLLDM